MCNFIKLETLCTLLVAIVSHQTGIKSYRKTSKGSIYLAIHFHQDTGDMML